MLYPEHYALTIKLSAAQKLYSDILDEANALLERTQPKGVDFTKEKVKSGAAGNAFDNYLIAKENARIDERLAAAKELVESRAWLLKEKTQELKASKETFDRLYRMRYIECLSFFQIEMRAAYSHAQIWRKFKEINKNLQRIDAEQRALSSTFAKSP